MLEHCTSFLPGLFGILKLTKNTISSNTAYSGGGLFISDQTLTMVNTSVSMLIEAL